MFLLCIILKFILEELLKIFTESTLGMPALEEQEWMLTDLELLFV